MGAAARPAFRAPVWQCVGGRRQVTDLAVCDAGSYEDDGSWSDAEVSFVRPTRRLGFSELFRSTSGEILRAPSPELLREPERSVALQSL